MSEQKHFITSQVWFIKRGEDVKGPFPAKLITRFILVGRLAMDDELSIDRFSWQRVESFPELIPQELQNNLKDPVARERLAAAMRSEDDRSGKDRREGDWQNALTIKRQRSAKERRQCEALAEIKYRNNRASRQVHEKRQRYEQEQKFKRLQKWQIGVLVTFLFVGSMAALFFIPPASHIPNPDCHASPRSGINWSNCQLQGIMLQGADLTNAYLRNANLSSASLIGSSLKGVDFAYGSLTMADLTSVNLSQADLTGANLRKANLSNANLTAANLSYADLSGAVLAGAKLSFTILDKAIWVDGRICSTGSIGQCLSLSK